MTEEAKTRWEPLWLGQGLPQAAPPGSTCTAHKHHQPVPTYCELHHVIPQAWQAFWRPDGKPSFEPDHDHPDPRAVTQAPLWDARTVALCPTGHRNVHYWLVKLMRGLEPDKLTDAYTSKLADVLSASVTKVRAEARRRHTRVNVNEFVIASQAIERVVEANGGALDVLAKLVAGGMWGEA